MSMNGEYVEVDQETLAGILKDPDSVVRLFMPAGLQMPTFQLTDAKREEFRRRLPELLAGTVANLPPNVKERLAQSLGNLSGGLEGGAAADAILKRMEERGFISRAPGAPGTASGGESAGTSSGTPGGQPPRQRVASPRAQEWNRISLEKAWHGVHYLLCGEVELPSHATLVQQVVAGGIELGEDFSGYGPARYFTADQVAEMARELARAELEAEVRRRYDPAAMLRLEIYPGGWTPSELDWLLDEFVKLREFFAAASARHSAIFTCIV